ncbi:HTH domain protein [Bacteriovorax sp. BSW11_IV]|uniref:helix-turn-helix transcriptional regulator n=1 Tax=Bacteriovorax sp. BSW11_IV TaxID=1353529 RepID=UPI00038A3A02|nr:HTH domain-containing protein [Bacteriovorax sp. BSW11_IV]EQC44610.1 HTH domain protein [Bacteriovorax sp. BSW11_IV]
MGKGSLKEKKDRQEQIVACLRSESFWTSARLCDELEISYRTLMRDLAELKEAGVPIISDKGRGGGISIVGRWGLNNLQLSNSEVITLLTSLAITESLNSPLFTDNINSIKKRISSAFPIEQQQVIAKIRKRILIGDHATHDVLENYQTPKKDVLKDLTDSFFNFTKIQITYKSAAGEITERLIEPQMLCLIYPIWYFLCWDDLRKAERLFRIDRILTTKRTNIHFKLRNKGKMIEGAGEFFQKI